MGEYSSLLVVDGNPAISYYDYDDADLKYVRSTTSTGNSASDWTGIVTVDDSFRCGYDNSLAIVAGNPAISYRYYDSGGSTGNDLKYARSTTSTGASASDWSQIVTVDGVGNVGSHTSLVVVNGNPAIAYYDIANQDLKYARSTTTTGASVSDWTQIITVDSTDDVGGKPHLAIVGGNPAIAHFDQTNGDVKYARSTTATGSSASDWTQLFAVDGTDNVGSYPNLAVIDGKPAISYKDFTNDNLKYVRASTTTGGSSGDWTAFTTVDPTLNVGYYGYMIAVGDSVGIVYHDSSSTEALKYAYYAK